jgi:hypothetical protein
MTKLVVDPQTQQQIRDHLDAIFGIITGTREGDAIINTDWDALEQSLMHVGFLPEESTQAEKTGRDPYAAMTFEQRWNEFRRVMDEDGYPDDDLNPRCPEDGCAGDLDPDGQCVECGLTFPREIPPLPAGDPERVEP